MWTDEKKSSGFFLISFSSLLLLVFLDWQTIKILSVQDIKSKKEDTRILIEFVSITRLYMESKLNLCLFSRKESGYKKEDNQLWGNLIIYRSINCSFLVILSSFFLFSLLSTCLKMTSSVLLHICFCVPLVFFFSICFLTRNSNRQCLLPINLKAIFAHSDHRKSSHDDLFSQEADKTEKNKKEKKETPVTDVRKRKFV